MDEPTAGAVDSRTCFLIMFNGGPASCAPPREPEAGVLFPTEPLGGSVKHFALHLPAGASRLHPGRSLRIVRAPESPTGLVPTLFFPASYELCDLEPVTTLSELIF